jgi:hypothetical protein
LAPADGPVVGVRDRLGHHRLEAVVKTHFMEPSRICASALRVAPPAKQGVEVNHPVLGRKEGAGSMTRRPIPNLRLAMP